MCHTARPFFVSEGVTVLAATTTTWVVIGFSTASALLALAPVVAIAGIVIEQCIGDPTIYERTMKGVDRFIDLTEKSRAELLSAPRLPLFDSAAAAEVGAAIDRALALKDGARRAIWPV